MADIAIERKSGGLWWLWLLLALLAIILLWFLFAGDRAGVETERTRVVEETGALTSLAPLYAISDISAMEGRSVEITDPVRVLSVTGDKSFWVGEGVGNQVLVVLDEQPTPGTATEGRYDVTAGQMVRIWGDVRQAPAFEEAQRMWGISGEDTRANYERQNAYIYAQRLEVVQ